MLVLSRKKQQAIQIGDDIEITVISIEGDQVKLGISAPKTTEIHRKEIYVAIQEQNTEAANLQLDIMKILQTQVDQAEEDK